jgi:hypothetical protein
LPAFARHDPLDFREKEFGMADQGQRGRGVAIALAVLGVIAARSAAAADPACVGDCNGDGRVTVPELILGINIALGTTELSACSAFEAMACPPSTVCIAGLLTAVQNALTGCPNPLPTATPSAGPTVTPTPAPTSALLVYWDQNEEVDARRLDGRLVQLVAPWDPNGQMCIFPDSSGRPGQFVTGYNPTLPDQENLGGLLPYKNPPVGLAVWDRHGGFTGQTIFVPGPYALPGSTVGGDIPPDNGSTFCTDGRTSHCTTDADCPDGSRCSGTFNNNGSFTGCAFDSKGNLFGADIGNAQGSAVPPPVGRIIEWFPPDYTSYCIVFGPTSGGDGPHHVNGTGGLRNPGMMAVDADDNLYVPESGALRVLKFDHASLPSGPADCGPDGLLTPPAQPTVFISRLAPMGVAGIGAPAGIARDPSCSTATSNCWAVSNVTSGTLLGGDTAAVYWFDDTGMPLATKGPVPKGDYNPFGLAVAADGDVYFISLGLVCSGTDCDTVTDGGALYHVTFADGVPAAPVKVAEGLNFPTSVTVCDPSTHVCPEPVLEATPVVQPTAGSGGG